MSATIYELPTWECFDLLRQHGIGRLCLVDGGYPIAVPLNYRLLTTTGGQQQLALRTTPDTMVGRHHGPCALEVDEIDLEHRYAWSVIARGTLMPVHGRHDLPDPTPIVGGSRNRWMTVDIAAVSGRRFELGDAGDGWAVDWQIA